MTAAMAAALGRSVESVRNAGLAALMPEPYGLIHRPWMHVSGPAAFTCPSCMYCVRWIKLLVASVRHLSA